MAGIIEQRRSLHRDIRLSRQRTELLQSHLRKLQPLADIGSISAMIAHEINNLLTPLGTFAELALAHLDDRALSEKALRKAVLNCRRVSAVMKSMMALANGEEQPKETVSVRTLVEDVFTCLCRDFEKDGISVHLDIPGDLQVHAVVVQIQQVLLNLILNAREAMLGQGHGTLTVRACRGKGFIRLEVADSGRGIAPEDCQRIFDRFYSTKDSSDQQNECFGTGLGLSFCKTVIESHGGTVQVESELGQGTTFRIVLPQPAC